MAQDRTTSDPLPADLRSAIVGSILGFLHNRTDATPHTLTKPTLADTHGSVSGGKFVRCMRGSRELPAGTRGFVFRHQRVGYSAYQRIDDEDHPAPGADIFTTGSDWSFVTLVDLGGGHVALADVYCATERTARRIIGTVAA